MNNKQKKAAVLKAAKALLAANNQVTTLEVKNKLRKEVPGQWFQSDVSNFMNDLSKEGLFTYSDNGSFRTYKNKAVTTPQSAAAEAAYLGNSIKPAVSNVKTVVKTPARKSISKTDAVQKIKESNGRLITVTWLKKDGKERKVTGQYITNQKPNAFGYLAVTDFVKARKGEASTTVQITPQTVKSVKDKGTLFVTR